MTIRLPARGFWSYAQKGGGYSGSRVSQLYEAVHEEVEAEYGKPVEIFQDTNDIATGAVLETRIKDAIANSTFLIPVITPTFLQRPWCLDEVRLFLEREKALQELYPQLRNESLIFPIGYREICEEEALDPKLMAVLNKRLWVKLEKWLDLDLEDPRVLGEIHKLASSVTRLLRIPVEPEEERAAGAAAPVDQPSAEADSAASPEPSRDRTASHEVGTDLEPQDGPPPAATGGEREGNGGGSAHAVPILRRMRLPGALIGLLVVVVLVLWSTGVFDRNGPAAAVQPTQPTDPRTAKGIMPAADGRRTPPAATSSEPAPAEQSQNPAPLLPAIQLGVFTSDERAQVAWRELARRFPPLTSLSHSVTRYVQDGRTLYRLWATGSDSVGICNGMTAAGQICLEIPPAAPPVTEARVF